MKLYRGSMGRLPVAVLFAGGFAAYSSTAHAEEFSLNYESLSSLEVPLAKEIEDVTLRLTGLVDAPLTLDLEDDADSDFGFIGNFQLSAETQLSNQWTVGVAYFGQYELDTDENYSDNLAGFVGGVWGTFSGGNVTGQIREQTRRLRGAGNAVLAFDDALASLEETGAAYVGRYGPVILSGTLDTDANFDLGASFQRPLGNKDYRFTTRYTDGKYMSSDETTEFDARAVGAVAEFIYGSSLFDLGGGYEWLSSDVGDADRWYTSAGARTKLGVLSLSIEGHYGQLEGEEELSAAFGMQYDVARGLSANLGVNYEDAHLDLNGVEFIDSKETKAIMSLRYSF